MLYASATARHRHYRSLRSCVFSDRHQPCRLLNSCTLKLAISLVFLVSACFAQQPPPREEIVFTVVEHQPEFPGGPDALKEYMLQNVRYPADAQKEGVKGRVFVSFIVEKNGSRTDNQILKGLGYGCDEEALRVIKAMPDWLPGTQSGREIRVKYNLPVYFGIDYPKPRKLSGKNPPPKE